MKSYTPQDLTKESRSLPQLRVESCTCSLQGQAELVLSIQSWGAIFMLFWKFSHILYIWKSIETYLFFPVGIEISHMLPSIMESGYMLVLRSSPKFFYFFNLIPFEVVPCLSFLSRDELFYLAPLRKFRVEACKFGRKNVVLFLPLDSLVTSEVRKSVTRSCTWVIYFYLSKKEEERGRGWSKCYTWSQPLNSIPLPSKYYGAYGAKYMFPWARIGSTPSLSNNYWASYGI